MNQLIPKIFVSLLPFAAFNGADMKLIHSLTNYVVVEISRDGKVTFHDRFLKAEMEEQGISIPPSLRAQYNNQKVVYLNDPLFPKAFIEVYCPLVIADPAYTWKSE